MSLLSDLTALPLFHFSAFSPLLALCLLSDLFFFCHQLECKLPEGKHCVLLTAADPGTVGSQWDDLFRHSKTNAEGP
jgi:hypothetical protein